MVLALSDILQESQSVASTQPIQEQRDGHHGDEVKQAVTSAARQELNSITAPSDRTHVPQGIPNQEVDTQSEEEPSFKALIDGFRYKHKLSSKL
jgi:hypothetical protein